MAESLFPFLEFIACYDSSRMEQLRLQEIRKQPFFLVVNTPFVLKQNWYGSVQGVMTVMRQKHANRVS